uniref:Uncharacterized protein n=1 Tax=Arundo donax TaxID=35708 RepID=A0A0A8XSY2_ARUDO
MEGVEHSLRVEEISCSGELIGEGRGGVEQIGTRGLIWSRNWS